MNNATVMNDIQVIQKILEEYLGSREVAKVAVEISAVMQGETKHTHGGEVFFIHKDEAGKLVLTMESEVKANVQAILKSYLEEDEVQECIEQLMGEQCKTKATEEFETIKIPGSDSSIYAKLMKHEPKDNREKMFIANLKEAISKSVKDFEVFVNDPSMHQGKLQFDPGFRPAVAYSYNELEKIAKENGLRLGTKDEYILFMGWLITSLINEGRSEENAWFAVCTNSKELGYYHNLVRTTRGSEVFEVTGSRKVVGKCDLANVYKILAKDDKDGNFWLAGGCRTIDSTIYPLANLNRIEYYECHGLDRVGWFVR